MNIRLTVYISLLLFVLSPAMADEKRSLYRTETSPAKAVKLKAGAYRALLIANNQYRDSSSVWRPLSNPKNDALALQQLLIDKYGFPSSQVNLLLDADRETMYQAFNRLIKNTQDGDSVLIFYAGHGYFDKAMEEGYWIPIDAKGKNDSTYFSFATLRSKVKALSKKAQHTFLISDSCFSGSFLNSSRAASNKAIDVLASRRSVQILTAGGNEYVSDGYENSGHSPFSYYLLKELRDNNKPYLLGFDLAGFIRHTVLYNSEQTPQLGVISGAGHENGDFIFRLKLAKNTIATVNVTFSSKYLSAELTNKLATAQALFDKQAYIKPSGANAFESYLDILKIDPLNASARQGLRQISQKLLDQARLALQNDEFSSARGFASDAGRVDNSNPNVEIFNQEIDKREREFLDRQRMMY